MDACAVVTDADVAVADAEDVVVADTVAAVLLSTPFW